MEPKRDNYRLVWEETFSTGKAEYCALEAEVEAKEPQKNNDIVPAHVNTAQSETHKAAKMHFSPNNVKAEEQGLVIVGNISEGGYEVGQATIGRFSYCYGYLEIEATLPDFQKGVWPIFAVEADREEKYRIGFEIVAVQGDMGKNACNLVLSFEDEYTHHIVNHNFLSGKNSNGFPRFYPAGEEEKLAPGRHIFGFSWDKQFASFWCDGTEYCKIDIADRAFLVYSQPIPCHLTAKLSIGAAQIPAPDETLSLPTAFTIHAIRLYQDDEGILIRHKGGREK